MKTCGDPRVHKLFREAVDLYNRKNHDYAEDEDPMSNFRKSRDFGVEPWLAVMVRINDKMSRLSQLRQKSAQVEEKVKDTLLDIANYALIAAALYEEERERPR